MDGENDGDVTEQATGEAKAEEAASEPPPVQAAASGAESSVETVIVATVSDFVTHVLDTFGDEQPVWFRGQARAWWRLEPSLIRKKGLDHERAFRDEFERDAYPQMVRVQLSGGELSEWDWLFLQQHYRVPTRLMDWTESPLVGAFFALDETDVTDDADDAAVWALLPQELNKKSNIKAQNAWSVPMCGRFEDLDFYTLDQITRVTERELYPMAATAARRFDRIIAQSGTFTVAHPSHPEPLEELVPGCLRKYVLPNGAKNEMRRHVERLGFTASNIYPDLEHLGRRIGGRLP